MKLIFAADIIRHGDRASIYHMPEISTAWNEEDLGKLTLRGEMDAIELGKEFKKYYVSDNSLLSSSFQPNAILIRSTDFQRTRETARCIMKGMYLSQSETIPINIVPRQEDRLLLGFVYAVGKEMQNVIRSKYNYSPKLSKNKIEEMKLELKKINNKFGTDLNDLSDIAKVADVIRTTRLHGKSFLKKISEEEIEKIFKLANMLFVDIFKAAKVACSGAGILVKQILDKMDEKTKNKTSLKYMLFSAHDTNLLCMMSLLGLPLEEVPYLSNIKVELFKQTTKFFVRVSYLNKIAKIYSEEYCLFDKFKMFVNNKLERKCEAL